MIDMSGLLTKQGQLFLLLALGLLFKRKKILDDGFRQGLTELIIKLVLPCSIIQSFRMDFNGQVLRQTWEILAVSTALQLGCWLLALVLYRRQEPSKRTVLQYATLCSNAAFLGSPVVDGIFGSQGLMLSSIYLTPQRIAMWTVGLGFFTKNSSQKLWKKVLGNPCIDAVFIGLVLMLTQWQLPQVLGSTIQSVGGCNIALSMFLIGMICADVNWRDFLDRTPCIFPLSAWCSFQGWCCWAAVWPARRSWSQAFPWCWRPCPPAGPPPSWPPNTAVTPVSQPAASQCPHCCPCWRFPPGAWCCKWHEKAGTTICRSV